ncbi:hypothetical protein PGQ11_005647 [Apiospora arundinis]|uniref:Uncharacterized protein n=1 Tax=Apiospora arundinis TaxID=335852 RepID=A0ABR2JC19_9PEZI
MHHPRLSSLKALFFIINHIAATHVPHEVLAPRLTGRNEDSTSYDSGLDLLTVRASPNSNNIWAYRDSCNNCKKDCPKDKIQDEKDCSKCADCPKGKKPNKDQTKCEDDKDNGCKKCPAGEVADKKDCKKCLKKDDLFKNKKKALQEKRDKTFADYAKKNKDKRWETTKHRYQGRYKEKDPERRRKMVRRLSRCSVLVPLSMGGQFAVSVDELWDEKWVESDEMATFWPSSLSNRAIDSWKDDKSDDFLEGDKYLDLWMKAGEKKPDAKGKRDPTSLDVLASPDNIPSKFARSKQADVAVVPAEPPQQPPPTSTTTDLALRRGVGSPFAATTALSTHVDKRFIPALIAIFAAVLRTIAAVARVAVRVGLQTLKKGVRVTKGRNSKPKKDQRDKADKMSKDSNWKRCLEGLDPW